MTRAKRLTIGRIASAIETKCRLIQANVAVGAAVAVVLLLVAAGHAHVAGPAAAAARAAADAPPCTIVPAGPIATRWREMDARSGPLGCPIASDRRAGDRARVQTFEHGEIAFSPKQGTNFLVVVYQRGKNVVVQWRSTAPYSYRQFDVRWRRDGASAQTKRLDGARRDRDGLIIDPSGDGTYTIEVRGCNEPALAPRRCLQGYTVPVSTRYTTPPPSTFDWTWSGCAIEPTGRIGGRWRLMSAERSPLGCPTSTEQSVPGRRGARQTFQRGEIAWSPEQGKDLIVTAYRLWNDAVFEWSSTAPHKYHYWRYDVAHNGNGLGQARRQILAPPNDRGRIWTRLQGYGEYAFKVKGCVERGFPHPDRCKEGYTIPVRVRLGPYGETHSRCALPLEGVIGERWNELGAWDGPLRCPLEPASAAARGRLRFDNGEIATSPALGPLTAVTAYQQGRSIVVNWGRTSTAHGEFRVRGYADGLKVVDQKVRARLFEWAHQGVSGQYRHFPPLATADGRPLDRSYTFTVTPTGCRLGFVEGCAISEPVTVLFKAGRHHVAVGDPGNEWTKPSWARRTDKARVDAVATHASCTRLLELGPKAPGEDLSITLIARLYALDKHLLEGHQWLDHRCPGEQPTYILVNEALKDVAVTPVGTENDTLCTTHGDYDTFLKGLMPIAYRYRSLLVGQVNERMYSELFSVRGGHDETIMSKNFCELPFELLRGPESENHVLLIESARFLSNQLLFNRTQDARYDNYANGLGDWLLGYMQTIAKHDFLEYNSRSYQRYSMNALLNLHEFALQPRIRDAARILLDYTTTKFAVSSNELRRVGPFRRLREKANSTTGAGNDLFSNNADPQTGFFFAWVGPHGDNLLDGWVEEALIAGLAPYRPPTAAYVLATQAPQGGMQHRFYHGQRPRVPYSRDDAPGGVEIYYSSPSFLVSAGGMFLPSGYGSDDKLRYKQVGVVQPTTLLPTNRQLAFSELIRFDPFPNWRHANNTCVHIAFACGANLTIPATWDRPPCAETEGPWTYINLAKPDCGKDKTSLGIYVVAFRTSDLGALPPAPDGGNTAHNVGFIYAVESSSMSFADFMNATRAANTGTKTLRHGRNHLFAAPDGHRFTFRILPSGNNYKARVTHADDKQLAQDQRKLPLVEGPFLRSNGHSGYIEIRYPGCGRPLVLDFRRRLVPIVTASPCALS